MAILFGCPGCGKTLRVGDNLGGKRCKCPGCGVLLDIPVTEVSTPAPAAPRTRPASSASRSARFDAEDEARRRHAPHRQDDAELGEPDPYEEDEAPRRPRRKKKGSSKALVLWLTIGGGAVVLLGGAGLVLWLLLGGSGLGRERDYFPDDFTSIQALDLDAVRKSGVHSKLKKLGGETVAWGGIPYDDVRRKFEVSSSKVRVVVLELKRPATADSIKSNKQKEGAKYKETQIGKKTLHEPTNPGHEAFVIDGNLVIYCLDATALKAIVERGGKARCDKKMEAAIKQASFSGGMTMVATDSGGFGVGGRLDPEYGVVRCTFGSSDVTMTATAYFKDSKDATEARDQARRELEEAKKFVTDAKFREAIDSARISQSGASVTVKITIPVDEKGGMPFLPFF